MKRSNRILAVFLMTAFANSSSFGQELIASVNLPAPQGISEPQTDNANPLLVTAARHLRAGTIIQDSDIAIDGGAPDAVAAVKKAIAGKEVKRTVYAGKPLTLSALGSPTIIKRNAIITIEFVKGPLIITTDGRALDPGGVGDTVRVMNLNSKIIFSAVVVGANKVVTQ